MQYPIPTEHEVNEMRQAFQEGQTVMQLLDADDAAPRIAASDLYAYAKGDSDKSQVISEAMLKSPSMRCAYQSMVETTAVYLMPEAVAASSEEFPLRQAGGCQIRVEKSRAEDTQFYILITLPTERVKTPELMTIIEPNQASERLELPAPRRGLIQVSIDEGSGIPNMLRNPKTAIYLG